LSPFLYLSLFLCLSSSVFPYLSFKSTYVNFVIFLLKSLAVPTALSIDFIFLFFRYVCLSLTLTLFRSFSPSFKLSAKKFRLKPNETKKNFRSKPHIQPCQGPDLFTRQSGLSVKIWKICFKFFFSSIWNSLCIWRIISDC
jgi:hypothetical protein